MIGETSTYTALEQTRDPPDASPSGTFTGEAVGILSEPGRAAVRILGRVTITAARSVTALTGRIKITRFAASGDQA